MKILPFMDIPVVELNMPSPELRRSELSDWAEGDPVKLSVAFLCYINDGAVIDNYFFQIGFIQDEGIVTTKELILEVGGMLKPNTNWIDYTLILPQLRSHLALYFDKIEEVPYWGTPKFFELKFQGKTVRYLEGPHKGGRLKANQRREVILDERGEFAFGPMIERY